jgi:hypothetical protein
MRFSALLASSEIPAQSFLQFVWREKRNRRFLWIILAGMIVQFIIFKRLYPFADFFSDSYSYIFAASANLDVSIWPIGYSKFLRLFHSITSSDTALVGFQYFFFEFSCLYFFYSILYFYRFAKVNQVILLVFLFFNPLFLYICNYINSDPLFITLSVLWFTELLWLLQRPSWYHIIAQGLLLFLCFTVRNNAYIYPVVTAVVFALSRMKWMVKISGAALGIAMIVPFVLHTRNAAEKLTGVKQFSLFTGWQLANNALYIYEYIDVDTTNLPTQNIKELNRLSSKFYSIYAALYPKFHGDLSGYVGNFFIREQFSPLKQYLIKKYKITDDYSQVVAWGKSSVAFKEYGSYIIRNNMNAYFWQFILPNAKNYLTPPLEKLAVYNLDLDNVPPIVQKWFEYDSPRVNTKIPRKAQRKWLIVFPYVFFAINLYILGLSAMTLLKDKYKEISKANKHMLITCGSFLVLNFIFSASATVVVLRYEVFPLMICIPFAILLTEISEKATTLANSTQRMAANLAGSLQD